MDIIDKIMQRMKAEPAPDELRSRILQVAKPPRRLPFFLKILAPAMAVAVLVTGTIYVKYYRVYDFAAAFELTAQGADSAGLAPGGTFVLKSSKNLTAFQVKQILEFEPKADFDVESLGDKRYQVKPKSTLAENTVYAVAIKEGAGDRDYSWAFQVKAPFQVTETSPRDKGSHVPQNSTVEVMFNREGLVDFPQYFEISPAAPGRFEYHGDKVVFLPKNGLAPKTVYRVTIKKGLRASGSEDILGSDFSFAFETSESSYVPAPSLNFARDFVEFVPDRRPTMEIYSYGTDLAQATGELYQFASAQEFMESYRKSRDWDLAWAYYYWNRPEGHYLPAGEKKISSFTPAITQVSYQKYLELPQELKAGYYLVEVRLGDIKRYAWLQVSSVAQYFSMTDGTGLLWAYDFPGKKPLAGAEVSFWDDAGRQTNLAKADSEGLARFTTPDSVRALSKAKGPQFFQVDGTLPSAVGLVQDRYSWQGDKTDPVDEFWQYLSTDRPVYRGSDTARFWGVVRGRARNMKGQQVRVGLYRSYYWFGSQSYFSPEMPQQDRTPLTFTDVAVSSFDTITGELPFRGLSPGTYAIVVSQGDLIISSRTVEVFTYAKPAYSITVNADKQALFAGESVTFSVKAAFFDGTPAAKLKLKYYAYWDNTVAGELALDANGEGKLAYTPPYYDRGEQYYWDYWPKSLQFSFSPANAEEGQISGNASVLVFGPRIHMQSEQKANDGARFTFLVKTNQITPRQSEYIGDPAAGVNLRAKAVKTKWIAEESGEVYDPINRIVVKTYNYRSEETSGPELAGSTNGSGEWTFSMDLPAAKDAYWRVEITGADSAGRPLRQTIYPYYTSATYAGYYGGGYETWRNFSMNLRLKDDRQENAFRTGEQVPLEVVITQGELAEGSPVLFYRYQNNIDRAEILRSRVFSEEFSEAFRPSVKYRAVVVGPYGFEESYDVMATSKTEDYTLKILLEPDKKQYRPGEEARLNVTVQDAAGRGVASEVNLAVVDEAVFQMLPYYWQQSYVETLFRSITINPLSHGSAYAFLRPSNDGGGGGCFAAGTPVLLASGRTKPIEDIRTGDVVMAFRSETDKRLARAVVQGTTQHIVDEYLLINGELKVTPEHVMFINGKWDFASNAKVGDVFVGSRGEAELLRSTRLIRAPGTVVYNLTVGKYHTYFAGGYWVHNAGKGDGEARINFVDTAFFQNVETGKDGRGEVRFRLADNVTSWRVTAQAFDTEKIQAGQQQELLPASLPFFVEATMAEEYLTGDKPEIRLRAFGTSLREGEPVTFTVKSGSLNFERKTEGSGNMAYIGLEALPAGTHELAISASQGSQSDAIVRKIKVADSYFRAQAGQSYRLEENLRNIAGNGDGWTTLLFSDAAKGKFYRPIQSLQYQWGIRVDQLTVKHWALKLLSEHFGQREPLEPLDLRPYHVPDDKGISLFPYSDGDLAVSALVSDLAPDSVHQSAVKNYFKNSLRDEKADIHRSARALYGLAALREPVLVKLQLLATEKDLTLEDKMYVALGLAKLGDREGARRIYENEIRPQLNFQGPDAWFEGIADETARVKHTALAGILASYLHSGDVNQLWSYLMGHYPVKDLDILERALIAKYELGRAAGKSAASFTYDTGKRREPVELKNGNTFQLLLPADELQALRFSDIRGDVEVATGYERPENPDALKKDGNLQLARTYLVNDKPVTSLKEGDVVKVRIKPQIAKGALDGTYQIVDYLPAGLRPITQTYYPDMYFSSEGPCNRIWYPDMIVGNAVHFTVGKDFGKGPFCPGDSLNYMARVVSKGEYKANPALLQSMRDLGSLNVSPAATLRIK